MEDIEQNSVIFVVENNDLKDGVPINCPHTLAAFLYLKGNKIQLHIIEPQDLSEADRAPYFICGGRVFIERDRDPTITLLIGLSTYWNFDEKYDYERANVNEYKEELLRSLKLLRTFVFSRHVNNETDEELNQAIGSIRDLSNLLDHKCSFLEMSYCFVSEIEASFIAVAIVIWKKMELQRHTALFGLAKRFMGQHLTVVPDILDLSNTLIGDLAAKFESFLQNDCQKMGVHQVYRCNFSPNNEYGLPDGSFIVKTYAAGRAWFNPSFESEFFYLRVFKPYHIAAEIIAKAANRDIECVVLKYYPRGDIRSKLSDTNLTWSEALQILIRMSYIFHVIHSFYSPDKFVYQDFKPDNFLIDGDDIIICDLESICYEGCTFTVESAPYLEDVEHGVDRGTRYAHQQGDIFKIGKFIIELVTRIPLRHPITADVVRNFRGVVSNRIDEQPLEHVMRLNMLSSGCLENDARDIIDLAIQCMDSNLENRPTADMIADRLIAIKEQSIG